MISTDGLKVVTAEEMVRLEELAIEQGCSAEKFMEEAGKKVALAALRFMQQRHLPKRVVLLIGKGNKGGDAYMAGRILLEKEVQVRAIVLYRPQECSSLNQKMGEGFKAQGGRIEQARGSIDFSEDALIVDGLLGTGFKGKVESPIAEWIQKAMDSGKPILSIDIPSGLNGSTGEVGQYVIRAQETIALGLPKIGFFLRQGWNCIGTLRVEDFGLPKKILEEARGVATFPSQEDLALPKIVRTRHKYQAGYVVGLGGSKQFPGALKMTGLAALRAGAGIVRLFSFEDIGPVPLELISTKWSAKSWKEELKRAQAVFIGPGLGDVKKLPALLKTVQIPCVLDADALMPNLHFPEDAILTPHRGEILRLLNLKKALPEEELFEKAAHFSKSKKVILVLKGAPTFIFFPNRDPVIVPRGDPGMAKAGSGDVLTGIIAAQLSAGVPAPKAAILGVWLHALSGEIAASEKTSYCLIASDLIEFLPKAFEAVMNLSDSA